MDQRRRLQGVIASLAIEADRGDAAKLGVNQWYELSLGLPVDKRDYGIGTQILSDIGVKRMVVLTNNPRKYYGLSGYGLEVTDQIPLVIPSNAHNERYLRAKQDKLGHYLEIDDSRSGA